MTPAGGETELLLCGSEFRSPQSPSPPIISGKTHVVTVGSGTLCAVLPEKSNSERFVVVGLHLIQTSLIKSV